MLEEYKKRVLLDYEKKKEEKTLKPNMINPSPGKLRDECLIVYSERPHPEDDEILRLFFTVKNNDKGYAKSIENFNIDEFRPLSRLLNGKKGTPRDRNINLLAWLIDYQPRPYSFETVLTTSSSGQKKSNIDTVIDSEPNSGEEEKETDIEEPQQKKTESTSDAQNQDASQNQVYEIDKNHTGFTLVQTDKTLVTKDSENGGKLSDEDEEVVIDHTNTNSPDILNWRKLWKNRVFRKSVAATTLILLSSLGTYAIWDIINPPCMYWTGNHYERISCNQDTITSAIAYNEKVAQLRKITRPDTITKNSLGKIWYFKIKADSCEFYTYSGEYPLDRKRMLKPATDYMIEKYVLNKKNLNDK